MTFPAVAVEPYSVEPADLDPHANISQALAEKLDHRGLRLFTYQNGLRVSICEVFWASVVTLVPDSGSQDHRDAKPEPGTLVGVIHFLAEAGDDFLEDSHDQKLKPGYYTIRYGPKSDTNGDDALLLARANEDRDAVPVLSTTEVERMSKFASGTTQPAVLSLVSPESGQQDTPTLRMDDEGTCILQVRLQAQSAGTKNEKIVLAVVLATPKQEEGGS